jgi:hypothetical protein
MEKHHLSSTTSQFAAPDTIDSIYWTIDDEAEFQEFKRAKVLTLQELSIVHIVYINYSKKGSK